MIDKLIYKFASFLDAIGSKLDDVLTMNFGHCEKPDCPKKKEKQIKIINTLRVNENFRQYINCNAYEKSHKY